MEIYTATEKRLIEQISSQTGGAFLVDYLSENISGANLYYHRAKKKIRLEFHRENQANDLAGPDDLAPFIEQIELFIVKAANLMNHLERNGYILTFLDTGSALTEKKIATTQSAPDDYVKDFNDPGTSKMLIKYLDKKIIATPRLREFVENGFKNRAEIKFQKQYRLTWAGIIAALSVSILAILFTAFDRPSGQSLPADEIIQAIEKLEQSVTETIRKQPINKEAIHLHMEPHSPH